MRKVFIKHKTLIGEIITTASSIEELKFKLLTLRVIEAYFINKGKKINIYLHYRNGGD